LSGIDVQLTNVFMQMSVYCVMLETRARSKFIRQTIKQRLGEFRSFFFLRWVAKVSPLGDRTELGTFAELKRGPRAELTHPSLPQSPTHAEKHTMPGHFPCEMTL